MVESQPSKLLVAGSIPVSRSSRFLSFPLTVFKSLRNPADETDGYAPRSAVSREPRRV